MKKTKYFIAVLLSLITVLCPFSAIGAGYDGISVGNINIADGDTSNTDTSESIDTDVTAYENKISASIAYTPTELSERTCNFFSTVDNTINVTLLSSERDYAEGHYTEYYLNADATNRSVYCDVLNTLKTMAEINTNFKVTFFDPFNQNVNSYQSKYENFSPEYGDLLISCYTDFDGNIKERKQVIKAEDFFKMKITDGKKQITASKIENTLVTELKSLKDYRNINIGVVGEISSSGTLDYVKKYFEESDYIFKTVSPESENLNGYDCLIISAPVRDITLSEMMLLNNYLAQPNKSLIYISPRVLKNLPNFTAFLQNWGISVYTNYQLTATKNTDCFSKSTQLFGECATPYFGKKGKNIADAMYVADCCTPLEINENIAGVTVETLLQTKGDSCVATLRTGAVADEFSAAEMLRLKGKFPLILKSYKTTVTGDTSQVVTLASIDFLNSYLTFQNDKAETYRGDYCGNMAFFSEILETLNNIHRSEPSGLTDYAITLADKGIETTSGYSKDFIMACAVISVSAVVILLILALIIFGKRNKNARQQ